MEDRFLIRPEILSYVYISLFLYALNKFHKMPFQKLVFILGLVQIFWVNTQGLFILGIAIAFCFFLEKSFQRLLRGGPADEVKRSAVIFLAVVLASLINPYGIKGLLFPLKLFIRIGPERNLFNLNIKEFISPFAGGGYLLFKSYAVFYLCVVLFRLRKLPLHQVLFSSAMLFLAASANRNINLFVLSSLPVVIPGLNGLLDEDSLRFKKLFSFPGARFFYSLALTGLVFLYAYLIYMVVSDTYYIRNSKMKRFGTGVNEMFYPGTAVDYILKNNIKGRIFNDVGTGELFRVFFYPGRLVYIDGRLEVMEYEHFSRFIHAIAAPDSKDREVP